MPRLILIAIMVATVMAAPNDLSGQDRCGEPVKTEDLLPVDQYVADHNPLSASLRIGYPGIDEPNDFSELFRLPGADGRYVRAQGGLYALFANSIYRKDKDGNVEPGISSGTLFHIGRPTAVTGPPAPIRTAATFEDLHTSPTARSLLVESQLDFHVDPNDAEATTPERRRDWAFKRRGGDRPVTGSLPGPDTDDPRTIANDPDYRAARLRSILLGTTNP